MKRKTARLMASYFPEAGNFNNNNADMCPDVAGPSSSGSGDFLELSDSSNKSEPESLALLAAILDLRVTKLPYFLSGRVTTLCIKLLQCTNFISSVKLSLIDFDYLLIYNKKSKLDCLSLHTRFNSVLWYVIFQPFN